MDSKQATIKEVPPTASRVGGPIDWSGWLRQIERKRRLLSRLSLPIDFAGGQFPTSFLSNLTTVSFRLDGLAVTEAQTIEALTASHGRRKFRSRLSQRLRNHMAILRRIQWLLAAGLSLKVSDVIRWYTSLSCGLCNASLDESTMGRIASVVSRINSPRLRLQPAVQDVARLHAQMMADPLVPSFNGILSRLLLCHHLGRCGLPPVLFDAAADGPLLSHEPQLLLRLMGLISDSYASMLSGSFHSAG
jgi:hypothetical protein